MHLQHRKVYAASATIVFVLWLASAAPAQAQIQGFISGFEPAGSPSEITNPGGYASGSLLFQDQWTSGGAYPRVQTADEISAELTAAGLNPANPVRSGTQAILASKPDTNTETGGYLAYNAFNEIASSKVTFDWWARPLTSGAGADPAGLPAGNGKTIGERQGNTFVFVADSTGKRAAAVRFGIVVEPNNPNPYTNAQVRTIDYGTSVAGVWSPSGLTWAADAWYNFKINLDYSTKQYDFFVDGSKVNAAPIPFYEAAATSASRFYISKGTNQAGQIIDDVSITATPALEGDFDANGIVDGADFLLWQRDNSVGSLETWKTNFGATAAVAAVSAVPEPTSAMLALGSLLLGMGVRGSARRR